MAGPKELKRIIVEAIAEVQTASGRLMPETLRAGMNPFDHCQGWSSLNGREATAIIAARLDMEVSDKDSFFVDGTGKQKRARSLSEIVQTVQKIADKSKQVAHVGSRR